MSWMSYEYELQQANICVLLLLLFFCYAIRKLIADRQETGRIVIV